MPDVADVVFLQTVCDSGGKFAKTGSDASSDYGKYCAADAGPDSPGGYQFYVNRMDALKPTNVNMVVPMGGPQSGLFRFPRVGEQVLICKLDNIDQYYLLGFVPTAGAPFYPKDAAANSGVVDGYNPSQQNPGNMDDFLNDNGIALRYQKTTNLNQPQERPRDPITGEYLSPDAPARVVAQKTTGSGAFSEIGFYNKKAKWPDTIKDYSSEEGKTRLTEDKFSRLDVLNIQSTGDIESRAENYHLLKAKRVEFLSSAKELSPEARADNCQKNYSSWTRENAPLGDNPLDDSAVHKGDVQFRAGKRIIIKAVGEIRLQVGRTTLLINDDGFSVTTRKVNSNIPVPSDTSFSLKARDGITMFGESVTISSARQFSVSDAWGASVKSTAGLLNISGQQINQKTYDEFQYNWSLAFNGLTWAQNIAIGIAAKDGPKAAFTSDWLNYGFDVAKFLGESVRDVWGLYRTPPFKAYEDHMAAIKASTQGTGAPPVQQPIPPSEQLAMMIGADPVDALMAALDMVLAITAAVYATVEQAAALQQLWEIKGNALEGKTYKYWDAQMKSDFKDRLNLCAMCIDAGIIEICIGINVLRFGQGGPATIRLRQSGDIIIEAGEAKCLYAELKQDAAVPVSIGAEKTTANVKTGLAITKMLAGVTKLVLQGESTGNKIPVYLETL